MRGFTTTGQPDAAGGSGDGGGGRLGRDEVGLGDAGGGKERPAWRPCPS